MSLKKVLTLLLATAMVTSLFAGCGASSEETSQETTEGTTTQETSTESGEPTQLTVWVPPRDSDTEASWRPMLEKFEQASGGEFANDRMMLA